MKRILRIGMDVHSINYTLYAIEPRFDGDNIIYANIKVTPDPGNIAQFIENIKKKVKDECDILCGYEAGCLKGNPLCDPGADHNDDTARQPDKNR